MVPSAAEIYGEAFDQGLRPDPLLTVSEWADRHRRLSGKAASEPGPWRTSRTPYLREIMDCLSPSSKVERVAVMKGAQIGLSECGNNWIGYVKGVERGAALVGMPSAVDITAAGKRLRRGVKIRSVAGGIAKLELFNNLRKERPTDEELAAGEAYPAGYVHLPKVDAEYCKQLCSEHLVTTRNRRGYAVREWRKLRERNEALDCYVYARAAAAVVGLDRFEERHWRKLADSLGGDPVPKAKKQRSSESQASSSRPASGRRGDWLGDRRGNWLK